MNPLLSYLYEFLTVALPALIVYLFLSRHSRKHGQTFPRRTLLYMMIFAAYIFCVFRVTGAGTLYDILSSLQNGVGVLHLDRVDLTPLSAEDRTNDVLNVIMCVPFGLLLPAIWPKARRFFITALSGLLFSLLIELSQLLNYRATDIDDLIMNTLGAVIGYLCYLICAKILGRAGKSRAPYREQPIAGEHWVYILAMFLGRFLLYGGVGIARMFFF